MEKKSQILIQNNETGKYKRKEKGDWRNEKIKEQKIEEEEEE